MTRGWLGQDNSLLGYLKPLMTNHPQFRSDIIIAPQQFEGEKFYVLKDPLTRKFFRVREPEYFLIQSLDGESTPEEVRQKLEQKLGSAVPPSLVLNFIAQLEKSGFLVSRETEGESSRVPLPTTPAKSTFEKLIFLKINAFDPSSILARWFGRVRFAFSKPFLLATLIAVVLALFITISNWGEFSYSLSGLYQLSGIAAIWLTAFVIVALHEFAHAFTCKYFGCEVREMGFLLLYFQPCFYSNLSEAWLLPDKRKKMLIGFSGAYFQIIIWALATLAWRVTDPEAILNQLALVTMITSGILVLFNFNPLIKLDGYYLLSDYLGIPNLRKKAFHYLGNWFKRCILRIPVELPVASPKEKKVFLSYGALSLTYSFFLLGFVFWKLGVFLVSQLESVGGVLYTAIVLIVFKSPIQIVAAGLSQFLLVRRESLKSPRKLLTFLAISVLFLALLFFLKVDLRVSRECELRATKTYVITNPSESNLEEKFFVEGSEEKRGVNYLRTISSEFGVLYLDPVVKEGQKIAPGDLIARLKSNQYDNELKSTLSQIEAAKAYYALLKKGARPEEISKAREEYDQIQARLANQRLQQARLEKLWEQKLISQEEWDKAATELKILIADSAISRNELAILQAGARPEELSKAAADMSHLEAQARHYQEQIQSSQIKSPISGVVIKVRPSGDLITIADFDTVLVMIPISERDMDIVQSGQEVRLKVRSYPGKTFRGIVTKVSQQAESQGNRNIFWITAKTPNPELILKPGMTGHAKIYCGKKPIIQVALRRIIRWFRVEIWSWI